MSPSLSNILLTLVPHREALDQIINDVIMDIERMAVLAPSLSLAAEIIKEAECAPEITLHYLASIHEVTLASVLGTVYFHAFHTAVPFWYAATAKCKKPRISVVIAASDVSLGCTRTVGAAAQGAGDDVWLGGENSWVKVTVRLYGPVCRELRQSLAYCRIKTGSDLTSKHWIPFPQLYPGLVRNQMFNHQHCICATSRMPRSSLGPILDYTNLCHIAYASIPLLTTLMSSERIEVY
ncbi:hypothetical protein CHU98_g12122 [Xylaria longipes]|nr:hypothetical protein CHU98_g12122 [Xylaria longipes]